MEFFGRRRVLGAAALLGSAIGSRSAAAVGPAAGPIDLTDKANAPMIYRKLVWSLGEGFGGWWLNGVRYIQIGAELTPLWDMHVGMLFSVRDLVGGLFEVASISSSFYTDLKTGDYLKQFTDPLTGKAVEIHYFTPKVSRMRYGPKGPLEAAMPGKVSRLSLGAPMLEGGKIWLREDHILQFAGPPSAPIILVNDLSTYFAAADVIADPAVSMAPAGQIFSDLLDRPAWISGPGLFYSRAYGQKVSRIEDMPETWRMLMRRTYPDIYNNPKAALGG